MISSAEPWPETGDPDPFEPALIAVLREARDANTDAGRAVELRALIRALHARLAPHLRPKYAEEVDAAWKRQERGINGGPVFEKVVHLIFDERTKNDWQAKEVCSAIGESDPKPVFNVLGYLVRANRIRRVGRGRYWVPKYGTMIFTPDDLDGEPHRDECE